MSFELTTLGRYATVQGGFAYKSKDFTENGSQIVLKIKNIRQGFVDYLNTSYVSDAIAGTTAKWLTQPGDILISMTGSGPSAPESLVGRVARVWVNEPKALINQRIGRLQIRREGEIDKDFLFYLLSQKDNQDFLVANSTGSANQVNINSKIIESIACPKISFDVSKGIADLLNVLEQRIRLLRETNATLEGIAQALFKSWFVDFDPVRAKMEGRAPEGMDEATAALFPDGLDDSELGLVPKGWRTGKVSDLGYVVCGKTPPTSVPENYGDDVPFITIPDMHDLLVVTSTNRSLSLLGASTQTKKYLPAGSICVSCIATPGLVVRVTKDAQTNQQINSVLPFPQWGKAFPLFLLRRIGDAVRAGGSGGSVFHNLSKSGFEDLQVLLTDVKLAQEFDEIVEPLIEKIIGNQEQAQTLATLRDTLLPRLISGQLRLPQVPQELEAALP